MPFTGFKVLSDLENFMRDYDYPRFEADKIDHIAVFSTLKNMVDSDSFRGGDEMKWPIRVSDQLVARAHTELAEIPEPGAAAYKNMSVNIKQIIVNAGITQEALETATGGENSFGVVVDEAVNMMFRDWDTLLTQISLGDGTGRLAKTKGSGGDVAQADGKYTLICTNTYNDFGWDNTSRIRVGQKVDVYDGATQKVFGATVLSKTSTKRNNAGGIIENTVVLQSNSGSDVAVPQGSTIYVYGSKDKLPMGLLGILNTGSAFGVSAATFQGLSRTDYNIFKTPLYNATHLVSGGVAGTPCIWDLNDLTGILIEVEENSGKIPTHLLCHPNMSRAINRMNNANTQIVVSRVNDVQPAVGDMMAHTFMYDQGKTLSIVTDHNIPENVIYGICAPDLVVWSRGKFDFVRAYGTVWEPSRGSRVLTFEAPYKGWLQMGAWRTNTSFVVSDLRTNLS